jgi:hypothetical protein
VAQTREAFYGRRCFERNISFKRSGYPVYDGEKLGPYVSRQVSIQLGVLFYHKAVSQGNVLIQVFLSTGYFIDVILDLLQNT